MKIYNMLVAELKTGDLWDSVENWVYSGLARGVPEVAKYFVPNRGENKLVSTLLFMCCHRLNAREGSGTRFLDALLYRIRPERGNEK